MTHSKLHTLLKTHEIELCVYNGEGKEEWFRVEKIDESIAVEDYRIGARIYERQDNS